MTHIYLTARQPLLRSPHAKRLPQSGFVQVDTIEQDSLLLKMCLYSVLIQGSIELALLPTLEHEVRGLLAQREMQISQNLISVLHGILGLIETAKRESNPIAFV
jgi:hypothetical protein